MGTSRAKASESLSPDSKSGKKATVRRDNDVVNRGSESLWYTIATSTVQQPEAVAKPSRILHGVKPVHLGAPVQTNVIGGPKVAPISSIFSSGLNGVAQRQEMEEEEGIQTQLAQRQQVEEQEEPIHTRLFRRQEAGSEEEELVQGKFTTSESPAQLQGDGSAAKNRNGMPHSLKTGLEALSGMDLSGIRVHNNSSKPAQLNALAYMQGQDIHVGPGQEKHLPHEGWHAVQQMQGRVTPTMQAKGVSINDDEELEREADVMGGKALQMARAEQATIGSAQQGTTALEGEVKTKGESDVAGETIGTSGGKGPLNFLSTEAPVEDERGSVPSDDDTDAPRALSDSDVEAALSSEREEPEQAEAKQPEAEQPEADTDESTSEANVERDADADADTEKAPELDDDSLLELFRGASLPKQDPDEASRPSGEADNDAEREQPEVMRKAKAVVQRCRRRRRPSAPPPTVAEVTLAVRAARVIASMPYHDIYSKIVKQRMLVHHYKALHSMRKRLLYAPGRSRDEQRVFHMRERVKRLADGLYWQVRNTKAFKAIVSRKRAAKTRAKRRRLRQLATTYPVPLLTKTVAVDTLMAAAERIRLPPPTSSAGRTLGKMNHRRALSELITANTPNPTVKPAELNTHRRVSGGDLRRARVAVMTITGVRNKFSIAAGKLIAEHRSLYRVMRRTTVHSLRHIPKADRTLIFRAASRRVRALLAAWKRALKLLRKAKRQWKTANAALVQAQ